MKDDVSVERRREVTRQARPVRAAVERHEQETLRAGKEHVGLARVFSEAPHRGIAWQFGAQQLPALAEVRRPHDVRREIAGAVGVEGDVRRAS